MRRRMGWPQTSGAICKTKPSSPAPPNSAYRFQKLVHRNKLAFTAAVVAAATLLLGIVVSTWQAAKATRAKRDADASRQIAEANELTARLNAYAADMNTTRQAIDEGNYRRALERLNRQRPGPGQTDLRGWEWRYLWGQARSDALFTLPREGSRQIVSLAVSPDGRWLATGAGRQAGLTVWDLRTKREAARLARDEKFAYTAFSPTQPLLAFSSLRTTPSGQEENRLHFWDTDQQKIIRELPLEEACFGVVFSKDGSKLATFCPTAINLWQMPAGTKITTFRHEPRSFSEGATDFTVTPDFSLAAFGSGYNLRVVDLRRGTVMWAAKPWPTIFVQALAFSPDGKTLAGAGGYAVTDIRLWDAATGEEKGRLEGHTSWTTSLVFWPDGKTLASSSADQTIRIWELTGKTCVDICAGRGSKFGGWCCCPMRKRWSAAPRTVGFAFGIHRSDTLGKPLSPCPRPSRTGSSLPIASRSWCSMTHGKFPGGAGPISIGKKSS